MLGKSPPRKGEHHSCHRQQLSLASPRPQPLIPSSPAQLQRVHKEEGEAGTAALDIVARGRPTEARWEGLCSPLAPTGGALGSAGLLGGCPGPLQSFGAATHSEFRERRPWKASGAISEIWLLLKSLQSEQRREGGGIPQQPPSPAYPFYLLDTIGGQGFL